MIKQIVKIYRACGDLCVATKTNYVEILNFRHFFKHIVFTSEGDKIRNKEIKNYINVSVVVDIECGNANNWISVIALIYWNKNCIFLPAFWNHSILQRGKTSVWQCISDIISWLYFAECLEHCQSRFFLFGAGRCSLFFLFHY